MINVQITSDQLKNKETLSALQNLLSHLGEQKAEVKEKKQLDPTPDVEVDPEILLSYGDYIKKIKTLYFLTLIKKRERISSNDLIDEMTKAFPSFQSRGIGGMTGALSRWGRERDFQVPYVVRKDRYGFNYFIWVATP